MSKNSARQTYDAFQDWYRWAKTKYSILRKKKKQPAPDWMNNNYGG